MKQKIGAATALSCKKKLSLSDSDLYDGQNLGFRVHCMANNIFSALISAHPVIYSRFNNSPFGPCWIGLWDKYIVALDFTDLPIYQRLNHQHHRWWAKIEGKAIIQDDAAKVAAIGNYIFNQTEPGVPTTWSLLLVGTHFQHKVWMALCHLHKGEKISYKECAERLNKPHAARAVGGAVGSNPISWLVPCHRIVGSNNQPGGFGWGLPMKEKMLAYETS